MATNLKPFTDGKFFKICMMAVVKDVYPNKLSEFEAISLSARTECIEEMAADVWGHPEGYVSVRWPLLHRLRRVGRHEGHVSACHLLPRWQG